MAISETELTNFISKLSKQQIDWIMEYTKIDYGLRNGLFEKEPRKRAELLVYYFLENFFSLQKLYEVVYKVVNIENVIVKTD